MCQAEHIKKTLTGEVRLQLVANAEPAGDTVRLVESDPREGSGLIPG